MRLQLANLGSKSSHFDSPEGSARRAVCLVLAALKGPALRTLILERAKVVAIPDVIPVIRRYEISIGRAARS